MWAVEFTDQFEAWWETLAEPAQEAIAAAVDILQEYGPACGRPLVDTIKGSRHPNMKELRPQYANIRVLFAFDPRRMAILLVGGDKTNRWTDWYHINVAMADELYDVHLDELRNEGLIP